MSAAPDTVTLGFEVVRGRMPRQHQAGRQIRLKNPLFQTE